MGEASLTHCRCVTILSDGSDQVGVSTMVAYADLALYDRCGRLAAVAEVKNRFGASREWAAQTRRNILAHGSPSEADFFLLVTPDRLYLWKDAGTDPIGVPPEQIADPASAEPTRINLY